MTAEAHVFGLQPVREIFLYDSPEVLGPRRALFNDGPLDVDFDDEFDVANVLEAFFPDFFDIDEGEDAVAPLAVAFKDKFDIYAALLGFDDSFDVLPKAIKRRRGVPDPDDDPTTQAEVRADARIQMPIGEVDIP